MNIDTKYRTNFEINQYKIDEFRKHAIIVYFIWRHVTQKRYFVHQGGSDTSDKVFRSETFWNNQKSLRILVQKLWVKQWFSWFCWPWPLTYVLFCLSHALGTKYWNLHAKFHRNGASILMDIYTQTHTEGKIKSRKSLTGSTNKSKVMKGVLQSNSRYIHAHIHHRYNDVLWCSMHV